jgi:hypothetical protein
MELQIRYTSYTGWDHQSHILIANLQEQAAGRVALTAA